MSKSTLFLILIGIFFLKTNEGFCQSKQIKFDRYTIDEGLSQSTVNCIIQDNQGFIWTGTQSGLNRFDGYNFKVYKQGLNGTSGLTNSFINVLYQDKKGIIWIGTQSGGLNYYNPKTNQFGVVQISEILESGNIKDIKADKDGSLWVATGKNGVIHYFPNENRVIQYLPSTELKTSRTTSLYLDEKFIWIGTEGEGLCLLNKKTDSIEYHINDANVPLSISDNTILTIVKGFNGKVLIGTNNGLNMAIMTDNRLSFSSVKNHIGLRRQLDVISVIYPASENEIYVGTQGNGLFRLTIEKGDSAINHYGTNDYDRTSISSNIINSIFSDRTGSVWIGTQDGLSHFDPIKLGFQHYTHKYGDEKSLNDKNVWAIYEGDDEITWVGTRTGISRINTKKNEYNHYLYNTDNLNEPNNNNVYSIKCDSSGRIWVGAAGGLYILETSKDFSKGEFLKIPFRDKVTEQDDDRVYNIHIENDSLLWIANREGIAKINLSTLDYKFLSAEIYPEMPKGECRIIYSDTQNNLWAGYVGGGLSRINRSFKNDEEIYSFINYEANPDNNTSISNNVILSILEDNAHNLWIGTYGGGLNRFNTVTNTFSSFTEENGLSNNSIYGVLQGAENTLWVSTNFGLSKFDMVTETFKNYHEVDGLQSNEFNNGAYFATNSGKLLFGGINGINAFYPENIHSNKIAPQIVLTDIFLFTAPIQDEIESLPEAPFIKSLELNSTQNYLTFKFSALHYTNPEGNKYKVFLEGNDLEPIELDNLQQINYSNLSPGDYTFKIWAANSDDIWTTEPVEIKIVITPPYWKTWWFISLSFIIFFGTLIGFYFNRTKKMVQRQEKLENDINIATLEIREQRDEILDSMNYAKRIQSAILPTAKIVKEYLKESFILYKPKDIIAGDFYWMEHKNDGVLFAAADCTGHGVPGAMVSVVCNNALNRSVREYGLSDPGHILDKTREIIIEEFDKSDEDVKDGMDIALCSLKGNVLKYAGAHNPLWIIRNGEIIETKANKQPIGKFDNLLPYTTHTFELQKGDSFYLFSDGYPDQFGGERGKKYKSGNFKKLLLSIQEHSMEKQHELLNEEFENWRGKIEQIDDVCVIGVRI